MLYLENFAERTVVYIYMYIYRYIYLNMYNVYEVLVVCGGGGGWEAKGIRIDCRAHWCEALDRRLRVRDRQLYVCTCTCMFVCMSVTLLECN